MKDCASPSLLFIIMKIINMLKSRGIANGSYQRRYSTNSKVCLSLSLLNFLFAFKYMDVVVIVKNGRDCVTVDVLGFFLQIE